MRLRAALDYNEEVNWPRILGERSNMIAYEMGASPAMIYTTTKTSPVENFKCG